MIDSLKKDVQEKCGSCNIGKLVKETDEGGNHVKSFSCGHRQISVGLMENPILVTDAIIVSKSIKRNLYETVGNITDVISVNQSLYFELTESVSVSGIKKNSDEIELILESDRPNMLKAFRINVKNYNDKNEITGVLQCAFRFTNLITMRTGMFVFHKRPRKIIDNKITTETVGGLSIGAVLTKLINLDMTNSEIINLLKNDSRENQQLAHFANGQRALEAKNYVEAIKEFYQVIEYDNALHLAKYKYLRDGLSHAELSNPETISILKNDFNIECIENPNSILIPKGKYVDITSPKIHDILEKEAKYLRVESIRFIDNKVKVRTN